MRDELENPAYHYSVIARALTLIDAAPLPLPLDELAAQLRMSPAHFQRVFSRWVGVSPKRYQQYLALDHARHLLATRSTTLAAAQEAGLTGGGRLHDLFLTWEAMTPGTYARGGDRLVIRHGWFPSPFGEVLAMATDRGLCGLAFADELGREATFADLRSRWPLAEHLEDHDALQPLVSAAFPTGAAPANGARPGAGSEPGPNTGPRLHLIGAPFQIKVWEALLRIPSGQVTTYGAIANALGQPGASRAVGTAVGRNPVSFLIPCHRALRKSGALGGYHWGLPVKRAMLAWEAARAEAAS